MNSNKTPSILMIMLCLRCGLGGAEKQYGRVFKNLTSQPGSRHKLLINRAVLELLQIAGIFSQEDTPNLIVLDPPSYLHIRSLSSKHRMFRFFQYVLDLLDIFWYVWQCWHVIRRYKPDIVHPLLSGMYLSLPALVLQPGIIHIMSHYAPIFKPDDYLHSRIGVKIGYFIKLYALRRCHAIDALTGPIRDDIVAEGIDGKKIFVAPCSFTDISMCRPAPQRKKWVVFVARFIEWKDPLLLAQAIPKILAEEPDVHFYFLGWGHLQPQLETMVQELGVVDNVTIKFDPHPTQVLNESSIFASLQTYENYPSQSLLEAMACGNAVVATDVGETWRLVDDMNGIRVRPTADAVAEAIIKLLNDPNLSQRQQASRERILSEHTLERFFKYITDVYRTAVADCANR